MRENWFRAFVSLLSAELKGRGFVRKGNSFYLLVDKNWLILNVQKSAKREVQDIFTINIGIFIKSLQEFMESPVLSSPPHCSEAQFYDRISVFLENPSNDFWWQVGSDVELANAVEDVRFFLQRNLGFLEESSREAGFLENLIKDDKLMRLNMKYIYGAYLTKKLNNGEFGFFIDQINRVATKETSEKARQRLAYFVHKLEAS